MKGLNIIALLAIICIVSAQVTCTEPSKLFTIKKIFGENAIQESWILYEGTDSTTTPIHSGQGGAADAANSVLSFDVCMKFNTPYFLVMKDTGGDGWGNVDTASSLNMYFNNILIYKTTMPYGASVSQSSETFTFEFPIIPGSQWKYTDAPQTGSTWAATTFGDSAWTSAAAPNFPVLTTTRYYRYSTSFTDNASIVAFDLRITNQHAVAIYVNGQEAYRNALPTGAISSTTVPTEVAETSGVVREIVVPKTLFVPSGNTITIAVEVHLGAGVTSVPDVFDSMVSLIKTTSLQVGFISGTPTCVPDATYASEKCPSAFDQNIGTKFLVWGTNTATITIPLNNKSAAWINAYTLVSANDVPSRDPRSWKFYGSTDGSTWDLLDHQIDQTFESRALQKVYKIRSNRKIYKNFKLDILSHQPSGNDIQLAEVQLAWTPDTILNPGLQYDSNSKTFSTGDSINVAPISSGYSTYTINPALPSGLTLNANTGAITGTSTVASTVTYTISALDGANVSSSFSLTLTFTGCDQPALARIYFRKVNKSASKDDRFVVYSASNTVILDSRGINNGADQTYTKCEPTGRYKIVVSNDANNGWQSGAMLDVELYTDINNRYRIARYYLISGTTETFYINTKMDLAPRDSTWKYFLGTTVIDPSWKTQMFADTTWTPFTFNPLPQTTTNIILLRKTFTVSTKTNMKGWELRFKSKAGTVVYINGLEVYRYNLPAGEITTATVATGGDTTYKWRGVSGPMKQITGNSITVAIGLVNLATTTPADVDFDCLFRFLTGSSVLSRSLNDVDCTASEAWGATCYDVFDDNLGTRYITTIHDSITPKFISATFKNNRAEYINKYCIISNWDAPRHDPVDWNISGTMDGTTFTPLTTVSNISWEFRQQRQCFYIPAITQAYVGYKLEITKAASIEAENRYALLEWELHIEDLDAVQLPPFTFSPSNLVAYRGIAVPALLVSSEYYSNFSISPALPSPLSLDTSNGYINGIPNTLMNPTTYTISAINPSGTPVATTISFSVIACQAPNVLFGLKFVFEGAAIEASWTLKDPITNTVIQTETSSISWATMQFNFCKPAQVYNLILGDTANDGWGAGYYNLVLEDGTVLSTGSVAYGESPKTVILNVAYLVIPGGTNWSYLVDGTTAPTGWNTASFASTWQSGVPATIPAPLGSVQYYRSTFTVPADTALYAGLEINIKAYAGLVIYVNGAEVYRANMPSGTITPSTGATSETTGYQSYTVTISLDFGSVIVGNNVLGIEMHKKDNLPSTNGFDGFVQYVAKGEYRVKQGTSWCDIEKHDSEGIEKLFDNSIQTKTLTGPRCVGAKFQWNYSNQRREYINQYKVTNANDCNIRHPSGWRIEGSNDDGATWTILHAVTGQMWTGYRQTVSYDFYNTVPYKSYQMVVTECNNQALDSVYCGDGNVQLAEWGLYTTKIGSVCQAQGDYSTAVEGGYSFKNCDTGYSGYKRKLCTAGVFGAEENLCVVVAPTGLTYSGSPFTFYKNTPTNIYPSVTGAELSFTITPSLPSGLMINPTTGAITGTPLADNALTTYTIKAMNSAGSVEVTVMIQVSTSRCTAENGYPITEAGATATKPCPDLVNYEGSYTRLCQAGNPAIWGAEQNGCLLKVPTITYTTPSLSGFKGVSLSTSAVITGSQITSITIAPALPNGLTFNAQNGQISGIPTTASSGTYTVTITNSRGSNQATLTITVIIVQCPIDGTWPATERDTIAYQTCPSGQSGVISRRCNSNGPSINFGTWATADSSNCYVNSADAKPGESHTFIRFPVILNGITPTEFNTLSTYETFRTTFVSLLNQYSIASTNVVIESVSASTFYQSSTRVNIRINVQEAQKDTVGNYIRDTIIPNQLSNSLRSSTDANLKKVTSCSTNSSDFKYQNNGLSGGVIALIVVLVVVLVAVVGVVVFCILIRMKGKSNKNHKKLDGKKKGEAKTPVKGNSKAVKV
ncbi:hypothetical protein WA158_002227 [Blastocystis sp. Blastoise]